MSKETLRELLNELRANTPATTKLFVNVSMGLQEAIYDRLEQTQMTIEELIEKAGITMEEFGFLCMDEEGEEGVFALGCVWNPQIEVLIKVSYVLDINLFQVAASEYEKIKHKLKKR